MKNEVEKIYSERTLLIVASLIILFIGLWLIFTNLWPEIRDVFSYKVQVSQLKKDLAIQEGKVAKVKKVFEEFHSRQEDVEKISLSLPNKVNYNQVLAEMNAMADISSLEIEGEDFQEKTVVSHQQRSEVNLSERGEILQPYSVIVLDIQGRGRYGQIKSFIQLVENDIRLMDIESFEINQAGGEVLSSDPLLSFRATIDFYKQEEE